MRTHIFGEAMGIRFALAIATAILTIGSFLIFAPLQVVAAVTCNWVNQDPGVIACGADQYTKSATNGNAMKLTGTGSCTDRSGVKNTNYITVPDIHNKDATLNNYTAQVSGSRGPASCTLQTVPITLSNTFDTAPVTGTNTNAPATSDGCAISDDSAMRWILCPIMLLSNHILDQVSGMIENLLYTPTDQIFSTDIPTQTATCTTDADGQNHCTGQSGTADLQKTYNNFRNLGLGVVFIGGLLMVMAEAAGWEVVSAYSVRKTLPQLILVLIFMVIAWPLLKAGVTLSNDLGVWAGQIILTTGSITTGSGTSGGYNLVGATELLVGAAGSMLIFGWGILGFIGFAILAAVVGLVVIAAVKLGQVLLIVTFPLLLAFSILPGTKKLWHLARDSLIGLFAAFPVISVFLATGKAASSIAAASGAAERQHHTGTGLDMDILALLALYVPIGLIVFVPRLLGGAFATISGIANDRTKGAFDRMRNFRQKTAADNWKNLKEGNRFRGNNALTAGVNKMGGEFGTFLSAPDKLGWFDPRRDRRNATREAARAIHGRIASGEHAKHATTQATQFNDDMLRAQTYESAAEARQGLARDWGITDAGRINAAITAAQFSGGFGTPQQRYAVDQLAATGTGYRNMEDAIRTIAQVSHGNESEIADMVGSVRSAGERAGRNDLKPAFGKMTGLVTAASHNLHGGRAVFDGMEGQLADALSDAALGIDNTTLLRNKPAAIENMTAGLTRNLRLQLDTMASTDPGVTTEQKARAEAMAGLLQSKLDNIRQAGSMGYSSEQAVLTFHEGTSSDSTIKLTKTNTTRLQPQLSGQIRYEPNLDQQARDYELDAAAINARMNNGPRDNAGNAVPPSQRSPQPAASVYNATKNRSYYNQNDPRNNNP